jgi:hypothetical protein
VTAFSWALLGGLVVVVGLQLVNRILGAVAGLVWTLALVGYGWQQMQEGAEIRFFFIQGDPRIFYVGSATFLTYSVYVLVQAIRRRPTQKRRDSGAN